MNGNEEHNTRKHWLNIRLTEAEHSQMMAAFSKATDRKLSTYARKLLLGKPVKVLTRNASFDEYVREMVQLRKELNAIGNNFNQLVRKVNSLKHPTEVYVLAKYTRGMQAQLLAKVDVIKSRINQFSDQWYQNT